MSKFKKSCESCKYVNEYLDHPTLNKCIHPNHNANFCESERDWGKCGTHAKNWAAKDESVLKEYEESKPSSRIKKMLGLSGFKVKFK